MMHDLIDIASVIGRQDPNGELVYLDEKHVGRFRKTTSVNDPKGSLFAGGWILYSTDVDLLFLGHESLDVRMGICFQIPLACIGWVSGISGDFHVDPTMFTRQDSDELVLKIINPLRGPRMLKAGTPIAKLVIFKKCEMDLEEYV